MINEAQLYQVLQEKFHFSHFREGQEEIIQQLLSGKDTLAILPTGKGKSLCYQLTGYLLPGTVLVVSPLISLMEDQVSQLQKLGEKAVVALNSNLSQPEKNWLLQNLASYKFIFISPEMLRQPAVFKKIQQLQLALFVVDEAHCLSIWGNDFRPEYRQLGGILQQLNSPLLLALTATATPKVAEDIKQLLFHKSFHLVRESVERQNISYFVEKTAEKEQRLREILSTVAAPGIIYCSTRKKVEELYQIFSGEFSIGYYHGGLASGQRRQLQQQFLAGELTWLLATNAFGMGINKGDIRTIIHYDLPESIENYLQEIGRAGRDGQASQAILLYKQHDEQVHYYFQKNLREERQLFSDFLQGELNIEKTELSELQQKWLAEAEEVGAATELMQRLKIHEAEKRQQLLTVLNYINEENCRREFLLKHFAEKITKVPEKCCDYHQSQLLLAEKPAKPTKLSTENEAWQVILEKIFKE
ncbi:ATP-dependent DNA helicase RecQ [Enterococcus sp. PF1-24]|uniref:RecQ family ATP-dependent DNA helicase n=1 Tax=unclassified Enterococcus TaxID=2608891 RepID=UPI002474B108|nr:MULTISPECIES: RecQ family ATP-dependent DNA helicase [unclassified Enterococcus]MDH6363171.1 ATP-dependent DNA helicase RecQ [Enterococcus sp. PFB1-1]MDH6400265.1 ATP-dependent DNA helicase RecQ [Enterococcus sp. PF1-24]